MPCKVYYLIRLEVCKPWSIIGGKTSNVFYVRNNSTRLRADVYFFSLLRGGRIELKIERALSKSFNGGIDSYNS